jgi:hypothetical protein
MKTIILSLAAIAAFIGSASAAPYNESTGTTLERRFDAHGNTFFVYVQEPQQTTTVAAYRGGHGLGNVRYVARRDSGNVEVRQHEDAHGTTHLDYTPAR